MLAGQAADTAALCPDHDADWAAHVGGAPRLAVHISAEDPQTLLLELLDGGNDVGNTNHRHILDGSGRGFGDGSGQSHPSAFGDDDTVSSGSLCGSDDGAQIVRVLDVVADDDEGRLVAGLLEDVLHGGEVVAGCHRNNALMDDSFTQGVQFLLGGVLDRDAGILGKCDDFSHAAAFDSLEDIDAVDGASFFECFSDGISAGNYSVGLLIFVRFKFSGQ